MRRVRNPESAPATSRTAIGWFTAGCVLVSNIIGGGIFTTTGILARDLGDPPTILLLWLLGALFAVGGAMVYGEMGSLLPHAGGDYVYLREAYGPLTAFLSGWTSFTIGFGAAVAASAISFSSYALRLVPLHDAGGWVADALALSLLWIATLVHCRGVQAGGRFQLFLTTTKTLAIGGLILGGLAAVSARDPAPVVGASADKATLGSLASSLVIVTYCYLGWNVTGYIAGEIANARRTLPRVMIGGTLFVGAIYLLLNIVYLSALSVQELAQEPIIPVAEKAATALWGPQGGQVVALVLCLSIAGAVSAMTWAGPRVYWTMAQDGILSSWLAELDSVSRVPVRAILLQSAWASFLILTGTFERLLLYSGIVLSLFTALTLSSLFRLRAVVPAHPDGYRAPFFPLLPALLVLAASGIAFSAAVQRPGEALLGGLTVLAGIPLYLYLKRRMPPGEPPP
ncbi:MAG TPA: APC family permease [Nitrospira sp.]|nr:APC family permease [Nitrospira sp.]